MHVTSVLSVVVTMLIALNIMMPTVQAEPQTASQSFYAQPLNAASAIVVGGDAANAPTVVTQPQSSIGRKAWIALAWATALAIATQILRRFAVRLMVYWWPQVLYYLNRAAGFVIGVILEYLFGGHIINAFNRLRNLLPGWLRAQC